MNKEKIKKYIEDLDKCGTFGIGLLDYFFAKWILIVRGKDVIEELLKALKHENQHIVLQVIDIIGKIESKQAIPYLKEMLKKSNLWGTTACSLGVALIRLEDREGVEFLKEKIINPQVHRELRINAARALIRARIKDVFKKGEKIELGEETISGEWSKVLQELVKKLEKDK